jgi:hypothetical protein
MAELHDQAREVAEAANKLLNEVARLRVDIARLHDRIEPFEGERQVKYPPEVNLTFRNFREALDGLLQARKVIRGCEYHLAAIRGVVDAIGSDAISRDEMKPWLRDR